MQFRRVTDWSGKINKVNISIYGEDERGVGELYEMII